jgi:hypothetical protein
MMKNITNAIQLDYIIGEVIYQFTSW